jgi:hypothetical protein
MPRIWEALECLIEWVCSVYFQIDLLMGTIVSFFVAAQNNYR